MNSVEFFGISDKLDEHNSEYFPALQKGIEAFSNSCSLWESRDNNTSEWKRELDDGDVQIHSTNIGPGKVFNTTYKLNASVDRFVKDYWDEVERIPEWNEDILTVKRLIKLTDNVDIIHMVSKPILMISSRDSVLIRIKRMVGDAFYASVYSVDDLPNMPPLNNNVRAFMHMNAACFRPHKDDPNVTMVDGLICMDLGGMIPRNFANSLLPRQLKKDAINNKKRLETK